MSTTERLRDTERRLDQAGTAVEAAQQAVATAAETAETVDRWRSNPAAIIVTLGLTATLMGLVWWLVGRSDEDA
jgi:hypothetical protein